MQAEALLRRVGGLPENELCARLSRQVIGGGRRNHTAFEAKSIEMSGVNSMK